MRSFRVVGETVIAELDAQERAVVARVVADVGLLLGAEPFGMEASLAALGTRSYDGATDVLAFLQHFETALAEPDDPALLRLLPNAAPTDREVADEFRRLTEPDLRDMKTARLRAMWEQLSGEGPAWVVPIDQALPTAAALTDVRLVIASRLEMVTDEDALALHAEIEAATKALALGDEHGPEVDRERLWLAMLYQALTWLQDSLVACVMSEDDEGEELAHE